VVIEQKRTVQDIAYQYCCNQFHGEQEQESLQEEFCHHSQAFIVVAIASSQGNKPKITILGADSLSPHLIFL